LSTPSHSVGWVCSCSFGSFCWLVWLTGAVELGSVTPRQQNKPTKNKKKYFFVFDLRWSGAPKLAVLKALICQELCPI
jgi:hypothetical protein